MADVSRKRISWNEFLLTTPPGGYRVIHGLHIRERGQYQPECRFPDVHLQCSSESCRGTRLFSTDYSFNFSLESNSDTEFIEYRCNNCSKSFVNFAVTVLVSSMAGEGEAYKYGQRPAYGPQVPPRAQKLVKDEGELFRKGMLAESTGLGLGAFAYYRRVVESTKDVLFDAIIRSAREAGSSTDEIDQLSAAKAQFQFSRSVREFKQFIPGTLLIDGHNPLKLLHDAMSKGLHSKNDEECLELAHAIRLVLVELADRTGQILRDKTELREAVAKLQQPVTKDPTGP